MRSGSIEALAGTPSINTSTGAVEEMARELEAMGILRTAFDLEIGE